MFKHLKTDEIVSTLKDLEEERERKEDADDLLAPLINGSKKEDFEVEPCEFCDGSGVVQFGEFDDIKTKKCVCQIQDDMDDDV